MTLPLLYHAEARAELRAAVLAGEAERSGRGTALEAAVARVELRLRRLPRSAPRWPGLDLPIEVRRARVKRFPYLVVYAILPDQLVVIAVAHTRRHPGYWQQRLDSLDG